MIYTTHLCGIDVQLAPSGESLAYLLQPVAVSVELGLAERVVALVPWVRRAAFSVRMTSWVQVRVQAR